MEYDLANELWHAGFPFKLRASQFKVGCLCTDDVCDGPFGREFRFDGSLYPEPTLAELIEAVGRLSLDGMPESWHAAQGIPYTIDYHVEIGATPEEAVARLWLALHVVK